PRQPTRWKSLMMTTSRLGSVVSARMPPATFNAGAYRVAPAPGLAAAMAADNGERSIEARTAMSAPDENSTTEPRSEPDILLIASWAAERARSQRSAKPML